MHQRSMLVFVTLALLVSACNETRSPSADPLTCRPTVGDAPVGVGSMVPLLDVPPGTNALQAWIADVELVVAELDDGGFALLAPLADTGDPYRGGSVSVRVTADGQSCGDVSLRVEGLPHPDEPGVRGRFAAAVVELERDLEEFDVERAGADAHLADLIAFLEFVVRSDDNPNALNRVVANGTVEIDGDVVAVDVDLVDSLLAHGAAAAAGSRVAGASAAGGGASTAEFQVEPASALRNLRDAVRLASTPTGLAGLLAAQDDAENVQKPALAIAAGAAVAASLASVWIPVIGPGASLVALMLTLSQLVLVETQVAFLPNDLSITFDIDSPDLDEDGEGRWSNLALWPSNMGSADVVQSVVGVLFSIVGRTINKENASYGRVVGLVSVAADMALKAARINGVAAPRLDWAPVPIPIAEANLWTDPYAEGVIVHHATPPVYEPTTTGPGRVGLRLKPNLFLNRDYHATHDVYVDMIQVIVAPETAVLTPGDSIDFEVIVLNAVDERVVWSTSDGIIRVEQTIFTWTAPDPAALSEACAHQDSVPFEIRAESISVSGARQLKYDPPVRFGVAEVEVECSDLTGAWAGRWTSRAWATGDLYVELEQNDTVLTGTVDVMNSRCLTRGAVSGTVSGGEATFGAVQGEHAITFSARLTAASILSGTYVVTTGGCAGDAGGFTLSRLP